MDELVQQIEDFRLVLTRRVERIAYPGRYRVYRNDKDQVIFEDFTKQ